MKVFVSWSVDQIEGLIATSLMSDNVEELRQLSQDLKHAADNLKAWSMAVGGAPILDLGTSGAVEVPADRMTELPAIAEKFAAGADATLSVGVGMTLSESYTAMRFSHLKGGDQISLYQQEMEHFVSGADQQSEDPLMELGKSGKEGQEQPVGFADGPEDEAPGDGGPQHGGANPAEGNSPVGSVPDDSADPGSVSFDPGSQDAANGGEEQPGEQSGDPRGAVVQALQQIKAQAPVLEQMRQTNPDAFEAVKAVVDAMIAMAQGMAMEDNSDEGEDTAKSESIGKLPQDLEDDMSLLGDEKAWMKAVTTPGAKVKHEHLGFVGTLVRPAKNPINGTGADHMGLVEHDLGGQKVQRWYPATHLSPHSDLEVAKSETYYSDGGPPVTLGKTDLPGGAAAPKAAAMPSAPQPSKAAALPKMGATGAPQLHDSVEGFMGGLKAIPKENTAARGKFLTAHANHAPFQTALSAHPQGAQVRGMMDKFLNSKANAGVKPGATVTTAKSEFAKDLMPGGKGDNLPDSDFDPKDLKTGQDKEESEHGLDPKRAKEVAKDHLVEKPDTYKQEWAVGTQKEGKIKVETHDPVTGASTGKKWRSVRAGQIMAEDGSAVSSRNPGVK